MTRLIPWYLLLVLAACKAPPPDPDAPSVQADAPIVENSCFWNGPWVREDPARNYAYPDTGAAYWAARFTLPENTELELGGDFAYARYTSLVLYENAGEPSDSLKDVDIAPDPGSRNPYLDGTERSARPRRWHARIAAADVPTPRAPNHLYSGKDKREVALLYRVYVPDKQYGRTGGVALPRAQLVGADGARLSEAETCQRIAANDKPMPGTVPAKAAYAVARDRPLQARTFPADDPPQWHAFYDTRHQAACIYLKNCVGEPQRKGGVLSNPDNAYLTAMINRGFGPLLVLHGRLPRIPATEAGGGRMRAGDLRYWSICNYEAYTQKAMACLYDEQLPLDAERGYTIVVSRAGDRPANARRECGVAWLEWTAAGDGAGHDDDGMLFLRNMLPSPGFTHAVQSTSRPGDEREVMGEYLPVAAYSSVAEFERRGCGKP
ncbi:hypothetical protein [Hydrocarboniphaga sp.]|uniref:hypothetical protein n=1 Tax=Hydrocarboniphaga sp. TaxID=2033016 RepID=UPI00260A6C06|nr:hypothetical protein [Hydrocarboniphaga sp.]